MRRVSTDMMNDDMQYWMKRRQDAMAAQSNRMNRQERLESLRDDPLAAARSVRYESFVGRLERYEENAAYTLDRAKIAEGYMRQTQELMQRVRELAVTGATGTFTKEDKAAMAVEVDQLLSEIVNLSNARGPDGDFLFAGDKSRTEPFSAKLGRVGGSGQETITTVEYLGGLGTPNAEISEEAYMAMNLPGDEVFWAERQRVSGGADASNWRQLTDSAILVDGHKVELRPGDTIQAVIAKINESGAPVKASLDPARNSLVLEGTQAHRIRLEDAQGGRTLVELGVLSGSGIPSDYAPSARVSGGSLFDAVMGLRDALYKGDSIEVGGKVLSSIDAGMENMNRRLAQSGAMMERLEATGLRLNKEIPDVTRLLAAEKDLDYAQAITDFKMMEYAHEASLRMAAKTLPQTLLDFLR